MIADFSLPHDHVPLPEMRPRQLFRSAQVDFGDVAWEEEIEGPVDCDPHFTTQPRHLGEINGSPQEPCKKSCNVNPEDASDSSVTADPNNNHVLV